MPPVKANFATIDGLVDQMAATSGQVDTEMSIWSGAAGAAEATWLDEAGGTFGVVRKEWADLIVLQQEMLAKLRTAAAEARAAYEATLRAGVNAVGGG
jgi:hypothetical protein